MKVFKVSLTIGLTKKGRSLDGLDGNRVFELVECILHEKGLRSIFVKKALSVYFVQQKIVIHSASKFHSRA
jgi:hypothetical protein